MEGTFCCGDWLLLCLALAIMAGLSFFLFCHSHMSRQLPPGPPIVVVLAKSLHLLRSMNDLSSILGEFHDRYGPIISIRLIFRTFIFVADAGITQRMLIQNGSIFASRPPTFEPRRLFTSGEITFAPYGHYWRIVRRNLATMEVSPARARQLAPMMRSMCDGLIHDLCRADACSENDDLEASREAVVKLRPLLRSTMFKLLVHRCFGVHLGQEALDEIHDVQRRMLHSFSTFPVFSIYPAVTKKLFHKQWAACVAVRRRQEELFIPMIHATLRGNGGDDTPCYARSLLDVRVPEHEDGHGCDRPLTNAEMTSLCSELLNAVVDTTGTLIEWIMAELVSH